MKKSVIIIISIGVLVLLIGIIFISFNLIIKDVSIEDYGNGLNTQQGFTGNTDCDVVKKFEYPPVNLEKTVLAVPLGLMSGGHVTPIDHMYFQDFNNDNADIEVYSPGDGKVVSMQYMFGSYFDAGANKNIEWADYRLDIEHDCGISSFFIHIDVLSDKLKAVAPEKGGYNSPNIDVEAGEIIGWYSNNVDYNVVDQSVILEGLLVPEHYDGEPWKIHTPSDQYSYFNDEIKNLLIEKSLRHEEPYSGKFDWDIDGTLQGNWFTEGSNGYGGGGEGGQNYWTSHLSFSPDYLDYNHMIISMGDYDGREEQFGAKGNSPKPIDVTPNTGLIKYELVTYDFYTESGELWDRQSKVIIDHVGNNDFVLGLVLVEMLEDRKIKFEPFPGKTKEEVSGFTDNAKIYIR